MTWNTKYTINDDGSITHYQLDFGRKVRSFPTYEAAKAFLATPEAEGLIRWSQGYWLKKVTTEILEKHFG